MTGVGDQIRSVPVIPGPALSGRWWSLRRRRRRRAFHHFLSLVGSVFAVRWLGVSCVTLALLDVEAELFAQALSEILPWLVRCGDVRPRGVGNGGGGGGTEAGRRLGWGDGLTSSLVVAVAGRRPALTLWMKLFMLNKWGWDGMGVISLSISKCILQKKSVSILWL